MVEGDTTTSTLTYVFCYYMNYFTILTSLHGVHTLWEIEWFSVPTSRYQIWIFIFVIFLTLTLVMPKISITIIAEISNCLCILLTRSLTWNRHLFICPFTQKRMTGFTISVVDIYWCKMFAHFYTASAVIW